MNISIGLLYIAGAILAIITFYIFFLSQARARRYYWSSYINTLSINTGFFMMGFGLISILLLFYNLGIGSFKFLSEMGVSNIILGEKWNPPKAYTPGIEENLGFLPLDMTTLMVAFISGGVSIFIGRAIGIATSQMKKRKFIMLLFLYIFLMIPSVTWAFMGSIYLQPLLRWLFFLQDERNILSTALTIAGLNIPIVAILTNAAISGIPKFVWDNARINQADPATRWKWYLKPEIKWQLWITSIVVIMRGAAETTIASRLMGGAQDLFRNYFWEWPFLSGNTLSKVASEYLRPESLDHPMVAPGGADFALLKIFINMGIVVVLSLTFIYIRKLKNSKNTQIDIPKKTSKFEINLFSKWIKSSCLLGIFVVIFVFSALVHKGGHMIFTTQIKYQGVCSDSGEIKRKDLRKFLSEKLGIEELSRKEKREILRLYSKSTAKGVKCNSGEELDIWLSASTQTDGYVKGLNPVMKTLFENRSFGPKSPQHGWIDTLMRKGSVKSLSDRNLDDNSSLIRITWNKTLFENRKFSNDPFKNGFRANFLSSLQNSFVAIFAIISAFLGALVIRFFLWKKIRVHTSIVLALSLSIPALGYGYMGKINFVDILGLPNAANITLYMTTWMVVFMIAIVNFTSRLQEIPESALNTGRSHSFRRIETIVKYVVSKNFKNFCLIAALAMTAGLQETSQWFPVGGLDLSLGEPSLDLLGEARPLNAIAYSFRAFSDPAFEALEACLHIGLIFTILPFATFAAYFAYLENRRWN